jgi:hypothetical protein
VQRNPTDRNGPNPAALLWLEWVDCGPNVRHHAPMTEIIVVPKLSVHIVTGDTIMDRPNKGLSATWAEVTTSDPGLMEVLSNVKRERRTVTLRCANLDAKGPITKADPTDGGTRFVLNVQDVHYRKPTSALEVRYRRPRLHLNK